MDPLDFNDPNEATYMDSRAYTADELLDWERDRLSELDGERLGETSPVVIALYLERLDVDERRAVLRRITIEKAAEVLSEMHGEAAAEVIEAMRERRAVRILEDLESDDAADIIAQLDDEDRERLLQKIDPESAETVKELLSYGEETAGGIMNPDVDTIDASLTVDEAIARIRTFAEDAEEMSYVYVVDTQERLQGTVSLRRLIKSRGDQPVRTVMNADLKGVVQPEMDREKVALLMAEYNLPDIAVVDAEGVLLGVITHDDVIDILRAEATEDIQMMSGAGGDESIHDHVSYSIRRRVPWLQFNLVTAFIASSVVLSFTSEIERLPLLAGFMPIIAGLGGNCGQQTLAVSIRSLAMGEIHDSDTRAILFKQLIIGLANGLGVGLVAAAVGWLITGNRMLAGVLLAAMMANMALAGVTGAFIPLLLRRFNRDPAQSSSIFLTAVTDTGGFLIFLSLGSWLLL